MKGRASIVLLVVVIEIGILGSGYSFSSLHVPVQNVDKLRSDSRQYNYTKSESVSSYVARHVERQNFNLRSMGIELLEPLNSIETDLLANGLSMSTNVFPKSEQLLFVNSQTGSDQSINCNNTSPCKSLSRALSVALNYSTILLRYVSSCLLYSLIFLLAITYNVLINDKIYKCVRYLQWSE